MDIISVITLVAGIILAFSGAIMALVSAQQKATVESICRSIADHAKRIAYLEQRDAVRDQEIATILKRVEEIYQFLRDHVKAGNERP